MYKKSPSGIGRFVKARFLQSLLVTVPLTAAIIFVSTSILPQITLTFLDTVTILSALRAIATLAFVLGLTLVSPVFAEESRDRNIRIAINLIFVMFTSIILGIEIPRNGLTSKQIFQI